jgi:hypothetical protein
MSRQSAVELTVIRQYAPTKPSAPWQSVLRQKGHVLSVRADSGSIGVKLATTPMHSVTVRMKVNNENDLRSLPWTCESSGSTQ